MTFQFTQRELSIVESYTGYASDNTTIESVPLTSATQLTFSWPEDAAEFVTALAKRGNDP